MSYQKERDEFIGQIVAEVEAGGVDLARLILRNASTVQRLNEAACNGDLTPKQERQEVSACHRIKAACKPFDIVPNFQGDPRGCCVKLMLPSGKWNSWGGAESGFCVPTR